MSIEVSFYPQDIAFAEEGAIIFGITQDKKRILILDRLYVPYFLLPRENLLKLRDACRENNLQIAHTQYEGELTRVFVKPKEFVEVARTAKKISDTLYNSDIPLKKRYWVDKKVNPATLCKVRGEVYSQMKYRADVAVNAEHIESVNVAYQPNILAFDIQTASEQAYPDAKKDPVIMIAFYSENIKRVITWKRFPSANSENVKFVDSEAALIEEFVQTIKDNRPELLVGYGSDNFDLPYLATRAKKYGIKLNSGWDDSEIEIEAKKPAKITGLPSIDLSYFARRILDLDTNNYGLDLVANKLLGKGKLGKLSAAKINEIWSVGLDEELKFLSNYNLTDAQLTFEVANKILPLQLELSKLTGLALRDINYTTYGALVEWFIIKNATILIPQKPSPAEIYARRKKSYVGGLVVEPIPGLYKDMCCFDFRSLYPSIIASHNISPETINCKCCQFRSGHRAENSNVWFCSKKPGLMPALVKDLVERRKRINEILKQTPSNDTSFAELMARQHALKYIAAAFYGYMGFPGSRFYSYECASGVTELGRKYISLVIGGAEKFGFKVLYGDTDSLFAETQGADAEKFLAIINTILPPPMELEFRAKYKSGLFLERKTGSGGAKKRYALLTEGGSLILRGLEAIRGDWSNLAKKGQKEILQILLEENDIEKAEKQLQSLIRKIEKRDVKIEDLVINVKLTRPLESYQAQGPHVVAAKIAKEKGYVVGKGFVVHYIVVAGGDKVSSRVKLAEESSIEDYDPEYYVNQQLLRATYKIFELFGYSLEKLKAGQTTLEGYGN